VIRNLKPDLSCELFRLLSSWNAAVGNRIFSILVAATKYDTFLKQHTMNAIISEYSTTLDLRIDWSEMDVFGHINNVAFFKYIQASRVNYWEKIQLTKLHAQTNIGPMLASTGCDFKKPLFYPGNIQVLAKLDFLKNTSFGLSHIILDSAGDIAAIARDVVVLYDFNANTKATIPADLRENMEGIEKRLLS